MNKIVKNGVGYVCALCLAVFITSSSAFAQSGRPVEPKPIAPVQETQTDKQMAATAEIPKPKALYEYLAPQNIVDFMLTLKEAGKRGFKLDKVTAIPSGLAETSREKANQTVLAGIVRFDGESRYDYNFFFAEGRETPDDKLNSLSRNGWYFRDVVSVFGGGIQDNPVFDNTIYKFPTNGNLYLLERVVGSEKPTFSYKLLKAGVRLGSNPTEKMQGLLDAAIAEGFVPVASYYTFDIKNIFSVDSFCGVLVGKIPDARKTEYKFVRGNRNDGLRKEIETFSKQGYRIGSVNFNTAILTREAGQTAPVNYQWVETSDKKYAATLAATLAKNPAFVSGGIDIIGEGDFIKNLLIFESGAGASEFQFAKMIPIVPKQFKKNPQDYLKTLEKPEAVFQRLLNDGYAPRDVFYSDIEGLTVLFERQKKN